MTGAEWLHCEDSMLMLDVLRGRANDRKLRLFAVACCRRIAHLLEDERSRGAVAVAERYLDGLASDAAREVAFHDACVASANMRNAAASGLPGGAFHCAGSSAVRLRESRTVFDRPGAAGCFFTPSIYQPGATRPLRLMASRPPD